MKYEAWLKARKTGIGGSDAAAVVGLNPYKTNVQLWEEKTGIREPEDISGKPYVQYGKAAEKHLRELFKLDYPEYKVTHKEYDMIRHPEYPFLFASLDGKLISLETGARGFLEIKTTNILNSMHREKWDEKIPDNYYCQILHYFSVTGYEFCVLKAHLITEWQGKDFSDKRITTKHYYISRADIEGDIDFLVSEEIRFWQEYVVPKRKPGLLLPPI